MCSFISKWFVHAATCCEMHVMQLITYMSRSAMDLQCIHY